MVVPRRLSFNTQGDGYTVDITPEVQRAVQETGLGNGVVTLFVVGSTASLTTIEFEPGAVADLARVFEKLALATQNMSIIFDGTTTTAIATCAPRCSALPSACRSSKVA